MPPAGTGSTGAASSRAPPASRCRLRARPSASTFEEGLPPRPRRRRGLAPAPDGGADSLSMLFRLATLYRSLRPTRPAWCGSPFRRALAARLRADTFRHPPARESDVLPGFATPARPVSLHSRTLGFVATTPRFSGLARAHLDRVAPGQPRPGPLARIPPPPRWPPRGCRLLDRRPDRISSGPETLGDVERRMPTRSLARACRRAMRLSCRRRPARKTALCFVHSSVRAEGRQARLHEPRRVSDGRGRRISAPAGGCRGHARGRPADPGRRPERTGHVRHARRPAAGADRWPEADGGEPARVPARPRGAGPRRPCPRTRLVGSPPLPRERPTGTTRGGRCRLRDRSRASGEIVGAFRPASSTSMATSDDC